MTKKTVSQYISFGELNIRTCDENNNLHSFNGRPSFIRHEGKTHDSPAIRKEYHLKGKLHRDGDKPALISVENGLIYHLYYKNGESFREGDKPSLMILDKNTKKVLAKKHYIGNTLHRENDKPALISLCEIGDEIRYETNHSFWPEPEQKNYIEKYVINGVETRDGNKPSKTIKTDGEIIYQEFKINGRLHRNNGTALFFKENNSFEANNSFSIENGKMKAISRSFENTIAYKTTNKSSHTIGKNEKSDKSLHKRTYSVLKGFK